MRCLLPILFLPLHRCLPLARYPLYSETPPAPNIFSRTRRYSSGSFSPLAGLTHPSASSSSSSSPHHHSNAGAASPSPATASGGPRLTPRVSQLRKEECADNLTTREVSHERGLHNQLQISQSWEDLTIVTENWSCRDETSTSSSLNCPSSPSPTSSSSRHTSNNSHQQHHPHPYYATQTALPTVIGSSIRYPFSMTPSPTRKTFATRRSMSPNHVRPSQLVPVKRRFDMDDSCGGSPPPHKKMFLDVVARGSSPIHSCASPDSGTYEGRTTPKLFISKLCSSNSRSSFSSASASPTSQLEGMQDGGGAGVDAKGVQSHNNNNNNNNSNSSVAETVVGGGGEEGAAKEDEEGEIADHPMLDVSKEENCDKVGSVPTPRSDGMKEKVDALMGGQGEHEPEIDDGIGGEEDESVGVAVPQSMAVGGKSETQESESVPVI